MHTYWSRLPRRALLVLAFCCVVAAFNTVIWPEQGFAVQWVYSVCIGVLIWLTIDVGRLLVPRRHCWPDGSLGDHGWPKGWRGLTVVVAGIAVGYFGGRPLAAWLLGEDPYRLAPRHLPIGLMISITASAIATFYFYSRDRQTVLRAKIAAAERDAAEARLMLLQSQLEPHMLFNTLANLRTLIGLDPAAAQQMLDRLNDFLRATLSASRATSHPLAAEFERLRDYLALMAIRMGPRLNFALTLPDDLREQPVPPLLLQPLVENAIKHGLEPRVEGGSIEVSATRTGDMLVLTVRDSGIGFDASQPRGEKHFGLTQVFERVASTYGGQGRIDVQSTPGHGTTLCLTLPCQQV
jgi:signal transduction histidine kinase